MEKEASSVKCFMHDEIPSFGSEREGGGIPVANFVVPREKSQQEDRKLYIEVFFCSSLHDNLFYSYFELFVI